MSREQEELDAQTLGALLRGEYAEVEDQSSSPVKLQHQSGDRDDAYWLQETTTDLMAVVDSRSKSTFPLFREAEAEGLRKKRNIKAWTAAVAIAAGALLAFSWNLRNEDPSITFLVEGTSGARSSQQEVGRVRAPADQSRTLRFSDGSTLKLAEGGSVRVRETDPQGAEVVIETGTLDSAVTHKADTSWSVFAGPYEVQVTGTEFSTQWDPESQRLVVLLDKGSVRVVGSDIEDHVALKPGQRFEVAPNEAWTVTAQHRENVEKVQPEEPAPQEAQTEQEAGATSAPKKTVITAPAEPSWGALLQDGEFAKIMSEAKATGLERCYASCSLARLRALADAARYSGDVNVARSALTRLRERSPSEAPRAGYLLGSLAEARGQAADAARWYSGYLATSPSGAFAAEARAGKMRALHALGRKKEAAAAAKSYLAAHPSGASAATARRILNKK